MGSHTWVRDDKSRKGGKSFAVGVAAVVPPSKKRKLVWQRGDAPEGQQPASSNVNAAPPGTSTERTTTGNVADQPPAVRQKVGPQQQAAAPATKAGPASAAKRAELEALRRQVEARQRELQQSSQLAQSEQAATLARQQQQELEKRARKSKLEAGFATAFAAAKDAATAEIGAARGPVEFANEAEVQRVLSTSSDYAVLQLQPGADAAAIRRRYREMAIRLHPDKCETPGASDAFHRLVKAYQQVTKYAK